MGRKSVNISSPLFLIPNQSPPQFHNQLHNQPQNLIEITARHQITPYTQGKLDGLCGLYAAINAIRLALHNHGGLSEPHAKQLFGIGLTHLDRTHQLKERVISGVSNMCARHLVTRLIKHAGITSGMHDVQIMVERPDMASIKQIHDIFDWIDEGLSQSKPVLVALYGALNHYSVIAASVRALV